MPITKIAEQVGMSKNTVKSYLQRKKLSDVCLNCDTTLLGYRYDNGVLMVVPTEAEVVRFIFESYLDGAGTQKIANELNAKGKITRKGCTWHKSSVMKILCNYTYTGNLILQTTYLSDHITKKPCKNNGELPKYHVENAHEPIISMEQYLAVQAEINRRTE